MDAEKDDQPDYEYRHVSFLSGARRAKSVIIAQRRAKG
jgi:hypothetical protein